MKQPKLLFVCLVILFSSFALNAKEKVQVGIYEDATFYTGVTKYYFKDPKTGKKFQIDIPNDEAHKSSIPKNLLEDPNEIEGIPGANPKMLGKKFTITERKDGSFQIVKTNKKSKKKYHQRNATTK